MSRSCTVELNGLAVRASLGETLVDAGLGGRVVVPHDCCSGQCETCRVEVEWGEVDDQGTARGNTVLACQATVAGDAAIRYEDVPVPRKLSGRICLIKQLSPDFIEVRIALDKPLSYLPGQYVSVKFAGYPARDYSPAPDLNGKLDDNVLNLHIKRLPGGIVSGDFGRELLPGHPVVVRGPFGSAFLRERDHGGERLLLMSTGTGFAPIWAIARAACRAGRQSSLEMIVAVSDGRNYYMDQAIDWLRRQGVWRIDVVNSRNVLPFALSGRPTDHMPLLSPAYEVYVCGAPAFVEAVEDRALAAGAACYADPFLPSRQSLSLGDRVNRLIHRRARRAARVSPDSLTTPVPAGQMRWSDWEQPASAQR